jgi:integrase
MSVPAKFYLFKRCNGFYYILYEQDDRKHWKSTGAKLKTYAIQYLRQFRETEQRTKLKATSLIQFAEDYLAYSKTIHSRKSQGSIRTSLREFIRIVGDLPLHKVGIREIENFLAVKKGEASEQTARTYFVTLASAFETARRWNSISDNPFRHVQKPKVRELQQAYFTKAEFQTLIERMDGMDFRDLTICAVLTGLRMSELTQLQWTDVDLDRKVIFVQNTETFTTKSKRNRVVPMSEHVYQVLAGRKEDASSELVFHLNGRRLRKEFVSKTFKHTFDLPE